MRRCTSGKGQILFGEGMLIVADQPLDIALHLARELAHGAVSSNLELCHPQRLNMEQRVPTLVRLSGFVGRQEDSVADLFTKALQQEYLCIQLVVKSPHLWVVPREASLLYESFLISDS